MISTSGNLLLSQAAKGWCCSALFHAVALGSLALVVVDASVSRVVVFGAKQQPFSLMLLSSAENEASMVSSVDLQVDVLPSEATIAERKFRPVPSDFEAPAELLFDETLDESTAKLLKTTRESDQDFSRSVLDVLPENLLAEVSGSETSLPSFEENSPPVYPGLAVARGWQGTVLLRLQVDAEGFVTEVTVLESSGHPVLDAAAANAVRTWRAQPATRDDHSVSATVRLPVHFRLP